jgi:WD40 repeat protein
MNDLNQYDFDYLKLQKSYKEKFKQSNFKEIIGHKKRVYTLDWLSQTNSNLLITGSADTSIKIWDIEYLNNPLLDIKNNNDSITHLTSNPNKPYEFLSTSSDKYIKFYDIRTNLNQNKLTNNNFNIHSIHSEKSKSTIKNIIFNNNGTQFVFCNKEENSILYVYDLLTFKQIKQIDIKTQINDFKFDKNDSFLFIGDENGSIHKINVKNFDERNEKKIDGHFFSINCIDVSNNNKYLITGGNDSLIVQFDINEELSMGILKRGDQSIKNINFNYDDKFIACIYEGNNIDFFSTELQFHIYSIFTDSNQYAIKWNKNKNIFAYSGDDKNRNGNEGNVHLVFFPI